VTLTVRFCNNVQQQANFANIIKTTASRNVSVGFGLVAITNEALMLNRCNMAQRYVTVISRNYVRNTVSK